jgi:hypothetical protein
VLAKPCGQGYIADVPAPGTQSSVPRRDRVGAFAGWSLRSAIVAVVVVSLSSGCLLKTKTAEGRALHDAPQILARASSVGVSLTVSSRLVRQGSLVTLPGPDPGYRVDGILDLHSERAAYTAGGRTVAVFDRKRTYALRPHARPSDARPWVQVSIDDDLKDQVLDPAALRPSLAALALRPSVFVDALAGALTGSIDKHGTDDVDGTRTTRYTARFDLTQALAQAKRRRYSQHEQDDLAKFFEVLGVKPDELHDGSVWLDDNGAPRRLLLNLREEPTPESLVVVTLNLRLEPRSAPATIEVPAGNSVTTVPSLFQFLQPLAAGA